NRALGASLSVERRPPCLRKNGRHPWLLSFQLRERLQVLGGRCATKGISMNFLHVDGYLWMGFGVYWFLASLSAKRTAVSESWQSRISHLWFTFFAFALLMSDRFS